MDTVDLVAVDIDIDGCHVDLLESLPDPIRCPATVSGPEVVSFIPIRLRGTSSESRLSPSHCT